MYKLLPVLIAEMGEAYPELEAQKVLISKVMKEEEEAFLSTIPDLYKCLNVLSYDELNEKLQSGIHTSSPDLNSSPTQPEAAQRLDPTMGYAPLVKDVSVFTAQRNVDVEDDTPF